MDKLERYQAIIVKLLQEYASIPYSYGDLERRFIISEDHNNYLLITLGWQNYQRVHGCLIHLEIINDKVWIHRDGTEDGIANDLVASGIPKADIVLAFHHPEVRQYTEYAIN
ncbi:MULTISPECIES: XisI protein [unclassified Tolypothrix]|uniref:XisI protein n=1 Tax=unclassified Tolypothrix TaxID=2649714 RepID=UPI0005EABB03|nr:MULTISPECIES: XisI protein [unclassified Tolypothrix]BAY92911.1 fdxN element excision controlling factor protein [Microchaete diplosiphon NIES-3275]EKF03015.1 heterocyst differentiation protein [Tolypothrix sp. PCC 7601]MBE9086606.1 XisI protein [Tolypothrix sp. LEGE 11397]UYD26816.1 XisI protein [Tolypothrix sp. PCC 7712]UYD37327.1 XisI protein [Tolypothrix sp. PCC 7601]